MNEEFARAGSAKKYAHEAEAKTLDAVLDEKRTRLGEVEAELAAADDAFEELKQKFTG